MLVGWSTAVTFAVVQKIWNVDLHELGTTWVSGRVPDAPLEDVLRSAIGVKTEGYTHQSVFWFPRNGGFEAMVKGTVDGGRGRTARERGTGPENRLQVSAWHSLG